MAVQKIVDLTERVRDYPPKQQDTADEVTTNVVHRGLTTNPHATTAAQVGAETPAGAQARATEALNTATAYTDVEVDKAVKAGAVNPRTDVNGGEWDAGTAYDTLDLVFHAATGDSWYAAEPTLAGEEPNVSAKWNRYAEGLNKATADAAFVGATVMRGTGIDLTGATLSTAAVQAKITAAGAGGHVHFPAGGNTILVDAELVPLAGQKWTNAGTTIKAADTATMETVVKATGVSGVRLWDLDIDVNKTGRTGTYTGRGVGIWFTGCTDCRATFCDVTNAFGGGGIPGIGIAASGGSVRCTVAFCTVTDCGIVDRASDGIFVAGDDCLISGCIATNCNDTGFVLEKCNRSGIVGCISNGCNQGGGITNTLDTAVSGNFCDGLTIYNWSSTVIGGFTVGCPVSTSTGNLLDTTVSGLTMVQTSGSGKALNVRRTGTADIIGLSIDSPVIRGATTQGIVVDGKRVTISDPLIEGTGSACIQVQPGSEDVTIKGGRLRAAVGSFGVYSNGADDVVVQGVDVMGGAQGIYFAGTATGARALWNDCTGQSTARVGSDAGTVPLVLEVTETAGFINRHHYVSAGTAPTGVAEAGAGGGATVTIAGNDTAGMITLNTGTAPAVGTLITITFAKAWTGTPRMQLTAMNALAGVNGLGVYASNGTTTTILVRAGAAPTASGTYIWQYHVVQ